MTAVVVAPLPLPPPMELTVTDPSAEARKRRREILASQRSLAPELVASGASPDSDDQAAKKRKVCTDDTSAVLAAAGTTGKGKATKKPQMKYDPDVPMTKEEAAVWRREQRRKRNRESAAASRQRQRDRIAELEVEVEGWKTRFDDLVSKIRQLEKETGVAPANLEDATTNTPIRTSSPEPEASNPATPISPVESPPSELLDIGTEVEVVLTEAKEQEQPIKMISRQAVKITGTDTAFPLLPDDTLLPPDPCMSAVKSLDSIDSVFFPALALPTPKEEVAAVSSTDDEQEAEFGEFLLDAVDWL